MVRWPSRAPHPPFFLLHIGVSLCLTQGFEPVYNRWFTLPRTLSVVSPVAAGSYGNTLLESVTLAGETRQAEKGGLVKPFPWCSARPCSTIDPLHPKSINRLSVVAFATAPGARLSASRTARATKWTHTTFFQSKRLLRALSPFPLRARRHEKTRPVGLSTRNLAAPERGGAVLHRCLTWRRQKRAGKQSLEIRKLGFSTWFRCCSGCFPCLAIGVLHYDLEGRAAMAIELWRGVRDSALSDEHSR